MKKFLAMFLVLIMGCAIAMAEEPDFSGIAPGADLEKDMDYRIELEDPASFAASQKDKVSVDTRGVFTVDNGKTRLILYTAKHPTLLCLTQDYLASIASYTYLKKEAQKEFQQYLIDNDIHYYLIDLETGMEVVIYTVTDDLSEAVDNYSPLSEGTRKQVLQALGIGNAAVRKINKVYWYQISSKKIGTIFNGQHILVQFGGTDDPAADLEDTLDILADLTLK